MTRGYILNIRKCIHGVGAKKHASWALKESWKFALKKMGTPDTGIDTRLNKSVWATGIGNVPYHVWLSRTRNEDEESLNKLCTLVTYVPVTALKTLPIVNVDKN